MRSATAEDIEQAETLYDCFRSCRILLDGRHIAGDGLSKIVHDAGADQPGKIDLRKFVPER